MCSNIQCYWLTDYLTVVGVLTCIPQEIHNWIQVIIIQF